MKKQNTTFEFMQKVWSSYKKTNSLKETANEMGIAYAKVRKILITLGKYGTDFSITVAKRRKAGKSIKEIATELDTTANRVNAYLPYEKSIYDAPEQTIDAKKSKDYRKRNKVAQEKFVKNKIVKNVKTAHQKEIHVKMNRKEESKGITAVHLHLELKDEFLNDTQKRMLKRYGESSTGESICRDILIPSDMPLHNLHYAIQKLFGWQNSHLRRFHLSNELYQEITGGTVKGWSDLVGILFQAPSEGEEDIFWDDDYRSGSIKSWLKKKYTGPYVYGGYMENTEEAKEDIQALLERFPMMDVRESFHAYYERTKGKGEDSCRILRKAPLIDLTLEEMNASIMIENGTENLLERLEVAKVLAAENEEVRENEAFPITRELIYNYDFGDNWEVYITKKSDCNELLTNGDISKEELEDAQSTVMNKHTPVCLYKDGVSVLDDVGGLLGFADFLERIYESEDKQEASEHRAWAQSLGWNARKVSNKMML